MFMQMMFSAFLFPGSIIVLCYFVTPIAWFQRLHPIFKIMIGMSFGLLSFISRALSAQQNELSLTYQILFGSLMGLWVAYWIHKSGIIQKHCSKK